MYGRGQRSVKRKWQTHRRLTASAPGNTAGKYVILSEIWSAQPNQPKIYVYMKIQSIVRAGMLTAVFGVFLFLNTLGGLWVESLFPYFFGLPILLCCLICDRDSKVPLCAFLAMFLLMFMLSGITTWLVAGSMLVCGYVFGRGAIRQKNLFVLCLATMLILFVTDLLSMTVFAAVFGFDVKEELSVMGPFLWMVSPMMILILLAFIESLLETLVAALGCVVLCQRVLHRPVPFKLPENWDVSPWCFWLLLVLWGVWEILVYQNNPALTVWRDLALGLLILDFLLMVWQGYLLQFRKARTAMDELRDDPSVQIHPSKLKKKRKAIQNRLFWMTFLSLMPLLNVYTALTGMYNLVLRTFARKKGS